MIGKYVEFTFAGGLYRGTVTQQNLKLSELYNHDWFWVEADGYRYPIAKKEMKILEDGK